jgi:hypothetical protein
MYNGREGGRKEEEEIGDKKIPVTKPDVLPPLATRRSTSSSFGTTRSLSYRWSGQYCEEGRGDD